MKGTIAEMPLPASQLEGKTDRALIALATAGDRTAYGVLFRRNSDAIWRMAYLLLHSAATADDAVQETFTLGLSRISTYRGEAEPKAWLYAIALNVCRQVLRNDAAHAEPAGPETLEQGQRIDRESHGVITHVLRREFSRRLAVALGFLTEAQRGVFVLHYVEDFPYEEVAGFMGLTPGAARVLAHRAKAVLREKLGAEATCPS